MCLQVFFQVLSLLLSHLADHVVEDASVLEVRKLHVCVEAHPNLKQLPIVQLHRGHTQQCISTLCVCVYVVMSLYVCVFFLFLLSYSLCYRCEATLVPLPLSYEWGWALYKEP